MNILKWSYELCSNWTGAISTKVEGRGWKPLALRLRRLFCTVSVVALGLLMGTVWLIWLMLSIAAACFYPYLGKNPDWSLFAE